MALPQYDMTELIANIKRRCTVPTSQLTYTEPDFAKIANDEMQDTVIPLIMSTREEYFVDYLDVQLPASGVIPFPTDSIGVKLRSVVYVQSPIGPVMFNLPRIDLDVVACNSGMAFTTIAGFYIQGNDIIIYPQNSLPTNTTIRLYFYKRRLVLTAPEEYGQIVAVDSGTNTVQLTQVPSDWGTGTLLNAVSSEPNFATTASLITVVSVSSPSIVVDSVEGLSVNDYVSGLGYSAIPQIPLETHAYLAQCSAVKCLEGVGDRAGMEAAQAKADGMKAGVFTMTSQRVDGSVKKIVNPSRLTGMGVGWRRGGWGGW